MDLSGKVGIITGASSGIGWETAKMLSEAGARLIVSARSTEKLDRLVEQLPGEAAAVSADIVDPAIPQTLVHAATENFDGLDFVFSNAGIMSIGSVDEVDMEAMSRMIQVNYDAAVRLAYTVLRFFKKQGHGDLITTSSILGTKVRATVGVYAGTKYAVEAMTESLRLEFAGTGIRIMVIEPGYTATQLQSHWTEKQKDSLRAMTHPLDPADIARGVKFMLEQPENVIIPRMLMVPVQQQL